MDNEQQPENNRPTNGRDRSGRFAPGNPGKPFGAASNKNKMRERIQSFIGEQWEHFPKWFSKLTEKEKIAAITDLLPYCVSRLQAVAMTDGDGNDLPQGPCVDYTKLSDDALREILAATTLTDNDHEAAARI